MNCFGRGAYAPAQPQPASVNSPQSQQNPMPNGSINSVPSNGSVLAPPSIPRPLSYVPPVAVPPPQPPYMVPQRLTDGLPDPTEIAKQKDGYAKGIDIQFRQGSELLNNQHKQTTDWLHSHADQQKQQAILAIDQQVKQEELQLSQKYNEQLMLLHQAAQRQRAELEQQANNLALEYQTKKTQEEYMEQQYSIQKKQYEQQVQMIKEMEGIGVPVIPQGPPNAPPWAPAMPPASLNMAPGMAAPPSLPNGSVSVAPGMLGHPGLQAPPSMGMMPPPNNFSIPMATGAAYGAMPPYIAPSAAPMSPYQAPPAAAYPRVSTSWVPQTQGQSSYVPAPTAQPLHPQLQAYLSSPYQHNQMPTQLVAGSPLQAPPAYYPDPNVQFSEPGAVHYLSPRPQETAYFSPRPQAGIFAPFIDLAQRR